MRCGFAPLASATQISGSPDRDDENAILVPSADHAGDWFDPPAVPAGKATMRPSSSEYIRTDQPSRPSAANAIRELSGEMRGESDNAAQVRDLVLVLRRRSPSPRLPSIPSAS